MPVFATRDCARTAVAEATAILAGSQITEADWRVFPIGPLDRLFLDLQVQTAAHRRYQNL